MARRTTPTPPPPTSPSLSSWFGDRGTLDSILSQLIEEAGDQQVVSRDAVLQMMPNAPSDALQQMEAALNARKFDVVDFYTPNSSTGGIPPTSGASSGNAGTDQPAPPSSQPRSPQPRAPIVDPITAAAGRSLDYSSIRDFRWGKKQAYLSSGLEYFLTKTKQRFAPDYDALYELTPDDFVATLLRKDPMLEKHALNRVRRWAAAHGFGQLDAAPPPRDTFGPVKLRWDMVEILAEAAAVRTRVMPAARTLATRFVLVALVRTRAGQAALADAGLLPDGVAQLAADIAKMVGGTTLTNKVDERRGWQPVVNELYDQAFLVAPRIEAQMSFAGDRAIAIARDPLGSSEDASALANLILLESVAPPLAIGLFGAWGSGKSTLIKQLQYRVATDLAAEAKIPPNDPSRSDKQTRRIRRAVQVEFNAWAYADSANLWASLTSEIFDQIAAGGVATEAGASQARGYANLVQKVRERSALDDAPVRAGQAKIASLELRVSAAEDKARAAKEAKQFTFADAVFATAQELLKKPSDKEGATGDDKKSDGDSKAAAAPDKKSPEAKDVQALDVVRNALEGGERTEERIQAYAEAGSPIVRLLKLSWDYARSQVWPLFALPIIGIAVFVIVRLDWPSILQLKPGLAAWLTRAGSLAIAGAIGVGAFLKILGPPLRVAALFTKRVREKRSDALAAAATAQTDLAKVRDELATERDRVANLISFAEKYQLDDGSYTTSPSLMLEYLLSDSEDVGALRQQLGVIARVRRCFEQLDAVIGTMREKEEGGALDRIILYIDDLDRCSAEQVAQVLQAVHLLLAFECFVVIVAVDARWLKESLERSQGQLRPAAKTEICATGATNSPVLAKPDDNPVTAADYLEKIFQIPFWVRPLVDTDAPTGDPFAAYRAFVRSIAEPAPPAEAPPPAPAPAPVEPDNVKASDAFLWSPPVRTAPSDEPRRESLRLRDFELKLLEELGPLAAKSPRAVKRMINLYRLARIRYAGDRLTAFLSEGAPGVPNYRELMFALACENGLSPAARAALRADLDKDPMRSDILWEMPEDTKAFTPAETAAIADIKVHLGRITTAGMITAFEEAKRYSFLR